MKLVRPGWLAHKDENRTFEIYSVDVSPDNKKLVTGGLDSKVKVWSVKACSEPDTEGPKLLASMAAHTGAVTTVKFSPDGRFIASGSDDRIVLISELDNSRQPRNEFGSNTNQPAETEVWTPRKRLVGHDNDVQDLAWSPDGQLLVSVGLDSAIIVWSGTTFEKLKRLDWHQSHVKGVCFDPANKFFVTCSDDRTARVVRYTRASPTELSFSVEAIISSPFKDSPITTYFRRCSWSPDGECIACPNATNGPIPTVAIIDRGRWQSDITRQVSLVGHEGTTEVAAFSPRMYLITNQSENPACVVATAGEDGKVAIWSTENPRPILVVQNIAKKMITDLVWSHTGLTLYASSLDGTVVAITFGNTDLGKVMPIEDTHLRLEKYGNATDLMDIPQGIEQIDVKETEKMNVDQTTTTTTTTTTTNENAKQQPATTTSSIEEQSQNIGGQTGENSGIEQTVDKVDHNTQSESVDSNPNPNVNPSSHTQSQPQPQQSQQPPKPLLSGEPSDPTQVTPQVPPQVTTLPVQKKTKQKTSITKDGKRRVTPMLLNGSNPEPVFAQSNNIRNSAQLSTSMVYDRPSNAMPPHGIPGLVLGTKRKSDEDKETHTKKLKTSTEYLAPVALNPATTVSNVRLGTPPVVSHISLDEQNVVFEARNASRAGDPTKISMISGGQVVFTDFIQEYASLITGSATHFWAVATDTGCIYTYTPQGSRATPPLVLNSPPALLISRNSYLGCITATGLVHLWHIPTRKAMFPPQSIAPCLDCGMKMESKLMKSPSITQTMITQEGQLILATSSGSVFTFNSDMMVWERISESFFAYGSRFWDSLSNQRLPAAQDVISTAEAWTNEEALLKDGARGRRLQRQAVNRTVQNGFHKFEEVVSLSHLSNRLVSAESLNSPQSSKYLEQYTRRLAERSDKLRLGELFRQLTPEDRELALKIASEYSAVRPLVAEYHNSI